LKHNVRNLQELFKKPNLLLNSLDHVSHLVLEPNTLTILRQIGIGVIHQCVLKINFWHDLWCGDPTFKVGFPALFGITRLKDAVVADNLELLGDSFQWNVSFIREVDVFASFFQLLHSVKVNRDNEDSLWWVPSKKGVFKVKSFFYSLTSAGSSRFPWKSVWRTLAP
jgi:hypothetical protein